MSSHTNPTAVQPDTLSGDALVTYLKGLQPGERVIETERSCLFGQEGTVYHNKDGGICVLWDKKPGEDGQMGTSVTGGSRRVSEVQTKEKPLPYNGGWRKIYAEAARALGYDAKWFGFGMITILKDGYRIESLKPPGKTFLMSELIETAEKTAAANRARRKQEAEAAEKRRLEREQWEKDHPEEAERLRYERPLGGYRNNPLAALFAISALAAFDSPRSHKF